MSNQLKTDAVFGTSFRVRDCYIWAEIFYLDSPTDYREYLPEQARSSIGFGPFTTLDIPYGFFKHVTGAFLRVLENTVRRISVAISNRS